MQSAATTLPAGARVLDAGSGRAPYRELFTAFEYVTADWPNSPHAEAEQADITCSLEAIPVADTSFDDVLCTQVLEHVPGTAGRGAGACTASSFREDGCG